MGNEMQSGENKYIWFSERSSDLLRVLQTTAFVGDPSRDWVLVKKKLRESNEPMLIAVRNTLITWWHSIEASGSVPVWAQPGKCLEPIWAHARRWILH